MNPSLSPLQVSFYIQNTLGAVRINPEPLFLNFFSAKKLSIRKLSVFLHSCIGN